MKIRTGFVSNSSSSSFIVMIKSKSKPCPHCGRKDPDILSQIKKLGERNDDYMAIEGKDDILEYVRDWVDDINEVREALSKLKDTDCVAYITVPRGSNEDSEMRCMEDVKVLFSFGD